MDEQLVLKNRLKVARAERGLSQGDLAKLVGVSRQTISSIETGQFNPTAKLALVLCIGINFLGMTKIKTANMLPALLVPVLWSFLQPLFSGAA